MPRSTVTFWVDFLRRNENGQLTEGFEPRPDRSNAQPLDPYLPLKQKLEQGQVTSIISNSLKEI